MSWEQLQEILDDGRQEAAAERRRVCPNDATGLERRPDGGLKCPFDGWTPEGGTPEEA